jgi:hypothetical protein
VFTDSSVSVRGAFGGETAREVSKDSAFMAIIKEMILG